MPSLWITVARPYEFPVLYGRPGAPYELPAMSGAPGPYELPFTSGDELELAGDMYAAEYGYEHARRCVQANVGMMLTGWGITGDFLGLGHAARRVARGAGQFAAPVAQIAKTATHAGSALVQGVRRFDPAALARVAAIRAKALAGSVENSVAFHFLRGIADKSIAPWLAAIRTVGPVLPYAQSVISFVPGVGTGVSAALGAAQAIADGRRIDQIAISAARGAVPGGPIATAAFDAAVGLAQGRPIDTAVLGALRERVPGDLGQRAFDVGLAIATAKNAQDRRRALQDHALASAASQLPRALPAGR